MRAEGGGGVLGRGAGGRASGRHLAWCMWCSCCRSRSCCSCTSCSRACCSDCSCRASRRARSPSSYFFEATCGEPGWVSWAGRGQRAAPHPPAAPWHLAHALHLLRTQPDALGSGADPLLLQTQLLPLPLEGLPLGCQLVLFGPELTGPDLQLCLLLEMLKPGCILLPGVELGSGDPQVTLPHCWG